MSWSISRAVKETGLSKSTISRAIKAGKISASRQDNGAYLIEPAELFHVCLALATEEIVIRPVDLHSAPALRRRTSSLKTPCLISGLRCSSIMEFMRQNYQNK